MQTIQASDPHIAKFLREQSAGLGVPSIQIERDPDTELLVGHVPGVPGAHTQGETIEGVVSENGKNSTLRRATAFT